jgi:acetyltransferase-like isoleucine patch superfamily enzyme
MVPGRGANWLVMADGCPRRLDIEITVDRHCQHNLLVVGRNARPPRSVHFQGSRNVVVIGDDSPWMLAAEIRMSSDDGVVFFGRGVTSNGSSIVAEGQGARIIIGDDCMFAARTAVRTSDRHAICDIGSGAWLNQPGDVILGPHVWVGEEATILKGVRIGAGAIIGAKALVTRSVPKFSVALGLPARVTKSGVTWQRSRKPDPAGLAAILSLSEATSEPAVL